MTSIREEDFNNQSLGLILIIIASILSAISIAIAMQKEVKKIETDRTTQL